MNTLMLLLTCVNFYAWLLVSVLHSQVNQSEIIVDMIINLVIAKKVDKLSTYLTSWFVTRWQCTKFSRNTSNTLSIND